MSQFQVWQGLSWLLDTSTAMVRLVFNGLFDRYPGIKIIIHHHGALIPLFAQRLQYGWDYFEPNTGLRQPTSIRRPYIEHFKSSIDTATQGNEPLLLQMRSISSGWTACSSARLFHGFHRRVTLTTDAIQGVTACRSRRRSGR